MSHSWNFLPFYVFFTTTVTFKGKGKHLTRLLPLDAISSVSANNRIIACGRTRGCNNNNWFIPSHCTHWAIELVGVVDLFCKCSAIIVYYTIIMCCIPWFSGVLKVNNNNNINAGNIHKSPSPPIHTAYIIILYIILARDCIIIMCQ